jgi:hypothetical protein
VFLRNVGKLLAGCMASLSTLLIYRRGSAKFLVIVFERHYIAVLLLEFNSKCSRPVVSSIPFYHCRRQAIAGR